MKPVLGVTLGDASGVGPEIVLCAYREGVLPEDVVVFGDLAALSYYNQKLEYKVALRTRQLDSAQIPEALNVINLDRLQSEDITPGKLNRKSGAAARDYVVAATRAALQQQISAMVTLPMNKEATQLSDPAFVGHTELIGSLCGVTDVTIMLASEALIVTHVSTHCSLAQAIERARRERIQTIIELTFKAVSRLVKNPRIAVAGLNPHAGENGLFGREEIEQIRPAVEWAIDKGMPVEGPLPPDTLFYLAVKRHRYDAVVCMYHDQGHVPLKLLDFEGGVNIAIGLPIVRTSVDHGTAFDIAGQGIADTSSFLKALTYAQKLIGNRDSTY